MKNITLTKNDYKILCDMYSKADNHTQEQLRELSIWQSADLACSEIHLNIGEGNLWGFYLGQAQGGDIVLITDSGLTLGEEYIGRCFRIHSRVMISEGITYPVIQALDTFSSNNHEYFIVLDDKQYLIVAKENSI